MKFEELITIKDIKVFVGMWGFWSLLGILSYAYKKESADMGMLTFLICTAFFAFCTWSIWWGFFK